MILCKSCFENSEKTHAGHRIYFENQSLSGAVCFCDCGRTEHLKCRNHAFKFQLANKQMLLMNVPDLIMNKIIRYLQAGFVALVKHIDCGQLLKANRHLSAMLQSIDTMITNKPALNLLVSEVFMQKVSQFSKISQLDSSPLQYLFLRCRDFNSENRIKLQTIFYQLSYNSEFVLYAAKTFCKLLDALIKRDWVSDLTKIIGQFWDLIEYKIFLHCESIALFIKNQTLELLESVHQNEQHDTV